MQDIFSHFIKIYLSKLHAIVYIDTDLDPDLETTHGSRSSPIPQIVPRSTPLIISSECHIIVDVKWKLWPEVSGPTYQIISNHLKTVF